MLKNTVEINITGIVQGVGFRPFLFNLAREFDLKGYLLNRGNAGVRLILQGQTTQIENFIDNIEKKHNIFGHGGKALAIKKNYKKNS